MASDRIAEIIKTADLYDLIQISLRSSDSKLQAVDRYIKRALEKQQHQASLPMKYSIAEVESAIKSIESQVQLHHAAEIQSDWENERRVKRVSCLEEEIAPETPKKRSQTRVVVAGHPEDQILESSPTREGSVNSEKIKEEVEEEVETPRMAPSPIIRTDCHSPMQQRASSKDLNLPKPVDQSAQPLQVA